MIKQQLFLDCDGVLADFDARATELFGMYPPDFEAQYGSKEFWKRIRYTPNFFRDLPLMSDARLLMNEVQHLNPVILTGCPYGDWAPPQKMEWAANHFPGVKMITCMSRNKRDHAKPGDVIIDDRPSHSGLWEEMGGVWINHTSAESSLTTLRAHKVL